MAPKAQPLWRSDLFFWVCFMAVMVLTQAQLTLDLSRPDELELAKDLFALSCLVGFLAALNVLTDRGGAPMV